MTFIRQYCIGTLVQIWFVNVYKKDNPQEFNLVKKNNFQWL